MINTTIGVLLPAMKVMPWDDGLVAGSDTEIATYTSMLMACIGEATGFIWSACITSQSMALCIELAMKWIYNKLTKEYLPLLPLDEYGDYDPSNHKERLILFVFHRVEKKHVYGLYVTHENWFILMVLFLWQCQWGWLNPNMFVMGAGTMLYITIIYKIRFTFLKPRIENQFIADLVREECFLYMFYLFTPVQVVVLLPFLNVRSARCNAITFGLPFISIVITVCSIVLYKVYFRRNRTPYLVAITKQWNQVENRLNDTRGSRSVAQ